VAQTITENMGTTRTTDNRTTSVEQLFLEWLRNNRTIRNNKNRPQNNSKVNNRHEQ
jgi:hypothetical protein